MNVVVCDNIRDLAVQLRKQIEEQALDPDTNREELICLGEAQNSMIEATRFLMQAVGIEVERVMSRGQV